MRKLKAAVFAASVLFAQACSEKIEVANVVDAVPVEHDDDIKVEKPPEREVRLG